MTQPAAAPTPPVSTDNGAPRSAPAAGPSTAVSRGMRETIESIAIALALAFLFKTFEAEAFVIPTGSMAPTLMGRHKDVLCPECGYGYTASGSDEADHNGYERNDPACQVVATTCPLCRYTRSVDPLEEQGRDANPSYSGDRIWVSKVPYHFSEPRRFDVIVFRYPLEAESYYIKRLVGLPNETVKIFHGDLYVKGSQDREFAIVRKPPEKLLAMAQIVHDNDYVSHELQQRNWPARWQSLPREPGSGSWRASDDARAYQTDGTAAGEVWIRYEHTVPSEANWRDGLWPPEYEPRPQLITDFYAFNARQLRKEGGPAPYMLGLHWVGDLILDCQVDVRSNQGIVLFDLVRGGRHFGCSVDVATGRAQLSIDGRSDWQVAAQTTIRGPGQHQVTFANADRQLLLWIDGKLVAFEGPTEYDDLDNERPRATKADPGDLAPLGIGSRGAALKVEHLRVLRDIYYIADTVTLRNEAINDYRTDSIVPEWSRAEFARFLGSPHLWRTERGDNVFDTRQEATFRLGPDQFFVLGDNSPSSSDARLWSEQQYVDRELLVGKALFVYWPHPLRLFVPFTDTSINVVPNVGRMHFIR
jgi:signal peptidase I